MKTLNILFLIVFCLTAAAILSAQTHINVLPGTSVEAGEEVYFDAMYFSNQISDSVQCEWDFGDGYTLKAGYPAGTTFETGICATHYFMNPGEFKVKFTASSFNMITSPPTRVNLLASDSVAITVTGEAPAAGFELWHAPFHARTAQYLYAVVPAGYNPSQVTARVEKIGGGFLQELTGTTEGERQKFLLQNASLSSGNYVVIAELKNGETVVSRIREKFSKPYDGAPAVGINENNAFILNGTTLFYPISPYMLNGSNAPLWRRVANTLHTEGYYAEHTKDTWVDYIGAGNALNMMTIGPGRWRGFKPVPYPRNSDLDSLIIYTAQGKNSVGLLAWCWDDEPNMGGRYLRVPAHVLAGWNYRTSLEDPQHPCTHQFYGFDWNAHYNPRTGENPYTFMRGASQFGGRKTLIADFFTHDAYPLEYKEHISMNYNNRGVIDIWLENLDNFNWDMAGLVPLGTFIEPQNVTVFQRMSGTTYLTEWDAGPTPGDVRTQAWGSLIHGMKFIGYFQHFAPAPAENFSAMAELKEAVTALTPVILSASPSTVVTHNANTRGNRVDVMAREFGSDTYIFAARISEPESEWDEVYEPETIDFQLNTGTGLSSAYDELAKYRWKYLKLDASEGQTEFVFTVPEGGIEPGHFIVSSVKNPVSTGTLDSLYDRWTGKGYPTAYDMQGNLKYGFDDGAGNITPLYSWESVGGTIEYSTGQVHLTIQPGIPAGNGFVQIAYAQANRQADAISMAGGIITDVLERNAVRIYRIPSATGDKSGENTVKKFELCQNYPNPFNPKTVISYKLGVKSEVVLKIYDILGREIVTLVNEFKDAGNYTVEWNGRDSAGRQAVSGVYFYRLKTGNGFVSTKKMILIK
ncbi:MAG: T9SS type A sorting domain-containing protein [Bacteroidetes bacterium]|nr:T9SS type A sorting domain-containing protein [Bacteroidota bacterium]